MKIAIIVIVFILLLAGASFAAFTFGKTMSYNEGEKAGEKEGFKSGDKEGFKRGREEGLTEGKSEGYKEGSRDTWTAITSATENRDDFNEISRKVRPLVKCLIAAGELNKKTKLFNDKLTEIGQQRKISPVDFGQAIGLEKGLIQGYLKAYKSVYSYTQVRDFYFEVYENENCKAMR